MSRLLTGGVATADMLGKLLAAVTTHAEKLGKEHRVLVIGNSRNPQNPKVRYRRRSLRVMVECNFL